MEAVTCSCCSGKRCRGMICLDMEESVLVCVINGHAMQLVGKGKVYFVKHQVNDVVLS